VRSGVRDTKLGQLLGDLLQALPRVAAGLIRARLFADVELPVQRLQGAESHQLLGPLLISSAFPVTISTLLHNCPSFFSSRLESMLGQRWF
jgi:hypothetical protein